MAGKSLEPLLRAENRSILSFSTSGTITILNAELGDRFLKGELLGEVDGQTQLLDLEARKADLADAESDLIEADATLSRRERLRDSGAISISSIDEARSRRDSAKARVESTKAQIAVAEQRLSDTKLVAPYDGEVIERQAEPAQRINSGEPVFAVISNDGGLEAIVNVPDRVRQSLTLNQTIRVFAPAANAEANGTLKEISSGANSAGLFAVTIQLESGNSDLLKAGQAIEAYFPQSRYDQSLSIPITAYALDGDGSHWVFVLNEDDQTVTRTPVLLGPTRADYITVLSGLSGSEKIVLRGVDFLSDGQIVEPYQPSVDLRRFND